MARLAREFKEWVIFSFANLGNCERAGCFVSWQWHRNHQDASFIGGILKNAWYFGVRKWWRKRTPPYLSTQIRCVFKEHGCVRLQWSLVIISIMASCFEKIIISGSAWDLGVVRCCVGMSKRWFNQLGAPPWSRMGGRCWQIWSWRD